MTPFFWKTNCETVTAPELPAVKLKERTGMRAAEPPPVPAEETNEPACGLSEAKLTAKPVDGATTEVVPVAQEAPVVEL
jgi:hypothetical protein